MGADGPKAVKHSDDVSQKTKNDTKVIYPNGNKYTGGIKDGFLEGHGVMHYKNGDVYKGEWKENRKSGLGTHHYSREQKKYVGHWRDNVFHDDGTIYYPDSSYFTGKFLDGEKHGKGRFVDQQGDEYDEEWKHGELLSRFLNSAAKKHIKTPDMTKRGAAPFRDPEAHSEGSRNRNVPKSMDFEESDHKDSDKKDDNCINDEKYSENNLNSNVLFRSENDFQSGDGKAYDVGLETLNVIEHIDMLNSVAGSLLNKDIDEWNVNDVSDWLKHLGLDIYINIFKQNDITGKNLFEVTESDLKDEFKMTSVGHRKNFMKAVTNLKKIYSGHSGQNSDYIRHKVQKFYDRNKSKYSKPAFINSLNSGEVRFYSQGNRLNTRNFYTDNQQIIEEGDEDSMKFSGTPSPALLAKNEQEQNLESMVLSESRQLNDEKRRSDDYCESEKSRARSSSGHDIKANTEFDIGSTIFQRLTMERATSLNRQKSDKLDNGKAASVDKLLGVSPIKKGPESKRSTNETNDLEKSDEIVQNGTTKDKVSSDTSSDSSSSSSSSDDERPKKAAEDKKADSPLQESHKIVKLETKIDRVKVRKAISGGPKDFRSAEYTVPTKLVSKHSYKEDLKIYKNKKEHNNRGKKGDLDSINQKIKEEILRKFRESGLNENFIINYNELFFEKKIGEGGYGRVYLGKFSGIDVAIKEYGKRKLVSRCAEEFVKEVEVISNLRHPNIVLYMGACIHNGKYLMITEYLEEGSLFDHLHKKHTRINEDVIFNIIEDIALGMCYLHGRKVLHCDLKSSNILIDSSWSVKLCDFGLSRVKYKSDKKRFAKQRVGTPHWMAPEILRGEKYDESADVYSFGMVLWEMIAGEIPYYNVPVSDIIASVGYDGKQIHIPTKGNPLILSIMSRCLLADRDARPTFKEIVGQLQQRNKGILPQKKSRLLFYLMF